MRGPRTAMKSGPRSPQLEKALAQKRRTQHSHKIKIIKKKKKKTSQRILYNKKEDLACLTWGYTLKNKVHATTSRNTLGYELKMHLYFQRLLSVANASPSSRGCKGFHFISILSGFLPVSSQSLPGPSGENTEANGGPPASSPSWWCLEAMPTGLRINR